MISWFGEYTEIHRSASLRPLLLLQQERGGEISLNWGGWYLLKIRRES